MNKADKVSNLMSGFRVTKLEERSETLMGNYFKGKNSSLERESSSLILKKVRSHRKGIEMNSAQLTSKECALQRDSQSQGRVSGCACIFPRGQTLICDLFCL